MLCKPNGNKKPETKAKSTNKVALPINTYAKNKSDKSKSHVYSSLKYNGSPPLASTEERDYFLYVKLSMEE
jgi:hypothetical protein